MGRFSAFCIGLAACLLVSVNSLAVTYTAPPINRYGQVGLFYSHSAMTMGMGRLNVALRGAYSGHTKYIQSITQVQPGTTSWLDTLKTVGDTSEPFIPGVALLDLGASLGYGITNFMDFSANLPLYVDILSNDRYHVAGGSPTEDLGGFDWGFGDLELGLKFQYPPYPHKRFFEMAYLGALSIPTGNTVLGYFPRHKYYLPIEDSVRTEPVAFFSSKAVEFDMKMLWTIDIQDLHEQSPVKIHVNYGARWIFNEQLDNLFLLNIAFEYTPVSAVHLFTEFSGETPIEGFLDRFGTYPFRLTPGLSITPPGGFHLTAGVDINLSNDTLVESRRGNQLWATRVEPQWRLTGTIGWAGFILPQDADQDGIKDSEDLCPFEPEDLDGFEDSDGCPDYDNDNDGIVDLKDKCPNDAEDLDGFEDEDGCPDYDNDNDGIADSVDQCPNVPEDFDDFEDDDGCPDYDNDKDGIPDSVDHCLTLPEDMDGFQDNDGCPDTDNDLDGVPDSVDNCPDVPGEIDNHGCPRAKPKAREIQRGRVILRGVNFESGKAILTDDSYQILDRVYESLVEWPEVKIEIRGHTDSIGNRMYNKRLSQKRAEAVRNYLMSRGVTADRLVAEGRGEGEPIAENTTAAGRAMNRRVELHRID